MVWAMGLGGGLAEHAVPLIFKAPLPLLSLSYSAAPSSLLFK